MALFKVGKYTLNDKDIDVLKVSPCFITIKYEYLCMESCAIQEKRVVKTNIHRFRLYTKNGDIIYLKNVVNKYNGKQRSDICKYYDTNVVDFNKLVPKTD